MPKRYSSDQVLKILNKKGYVIVSQKGSHIRLKKKTITQTKITIVPANKKQLPIGTFKAILKQTELNESDFS